MGRICCVVVLFVACVSSALSAGPLPFEELLYKGRAIPFYGNPTTEMQSKFDEALRRSRLAERMAEVAQRTLHLRTNLGIGFESCDAPSAYYDRQRVRIVICFELLELIGKSSQSDREFAGTLDRANYAKLIDGAIWGIFFHELGHAVIDINRVPITGREEDVADQFALYYAVKFIEPQDVPVVMPTIWFFRMLGRNREVATSSPDAVKRLMADEHSLDEQRTYNLACWAFGADQSRGLNAAKFVGLPQERARRCPSEYARLDDGINARFRKYLRVKLR